MGLNVFKHLIQRVTNRNGAGAHYRPPTASALVFDSALDFDAQVRAREQDAQRGVTKIASLGEIEKAGST